MITKEIIVLNIQEITPYERNNKQHSQEGVDQLVENYKTVGVIDPIYVDENNVILAGHKRWLALKQLKSPVAECVRVTGFKSEDHKNLYRINSNKLTHNSDWDVDNLSLEIATLEDQFNLAALGTKFDFEPLDIDINMEPDENDHKEAQKRCDKCGAWMS